MWIIGCRIAQSVFALVINMLTARYLGPSNFGLINYAASIVAFVTPVMKLGINNVLVNEIIQHPEKEGETLGTSLLLTLISSFCCIGGIAAFVQIANPNEPETLAVCILYSLLLICQSMELVQFWFQAKYMAKYTSLSVLGAYIVVSAYKIYLLMTQKSIYWFAVSNAFDYLLIAIALLVIYRKKGGSPFTVSASAVGRLLRQSVHYILPEMMVMIYAQTDRIMLKTMLGNEVVGFYAAAVTITGLTNFVFIAIIDSMRPLILESKRDRSEEYERNMVRLYSIVMYLALLQSLFLVVLAKPVVWLLYGEAYLAAVQPLRIVAWYTMFSYFGAVRNVWILAEGKQKYLLGINVCGAVANVGMNLLLIPSFGINGAAFASLVTQFFTNVITGMFMKPIRPNNALMYQGANPRVLNELIQSGLRSVRKKKHNS